MAEGIIVISTLLVFLGLIMWMRQAYGMKLDLQQRTRSDVLYFASHACEQTGGGVGTTGGGGTVPVDADENVIGAGFPGGAAVGRSWNTASGSAHGMATSQAAIDKNATGGDAPIEYEKLPLKSSVSAFSSVTCNEKKYDNMLLAKFQFAIDFVKKGGGGLDLFP
jgi:hypothetical protein